MSHSNEAKRVQVWVWDHRYLTVVQEVRDALGESADINLLAGAGYGSRDLVRDQFSFKEPSRIVNIEASRLR